MSKERLEEIKDKYKEDVYDCKLGRFDIGWLIEQAELVQELEADNYNMDVELEKLYKQNNRYRKALEFYAKRGSIARQALEEYK